MTADTTVRVGPRALLDLVAAVFRTLGVPETDAALVADTLVASDLAAHASHGVYRVRWYADRIRSGVMQPVTQSQAVQDSPSVLVLDGQDGVGQVIAHQAMGEAVKRAKAFGVAAVAVRYSNHFGRAAYYTQEAAAQDCIGILTTNASPGIAPWGGRRAAIGNNPWSIAAPAGAYPPVVLDLANTMVARGKIYVARRRGEAIPDTWALDSSGRPTTDPAAALGGLLQPMGGHKGYGISFMMDVLSGVLTGAEFATGVSGPYQSERRSGVGHLCIALNIAHFMDLSTFHERMDTLIAEVKAVPTVEGFEEVFYPGEREHRARTEYLELGVPVEAGTLDDVLKLAEELGIQPPAGLAQP